jgi:hypothetical protein
VVTDRISDETEFSDYARRRLIDEVIETSTLELLLLPAPSDPLADLSPTEMIAWLNDNKLQLRQLIPSLDITRAIIGYDVTMNAP